MVRLNLLVSLLWLPLAGCSSDDNTLVHACVRSTACNVRAYPSVSNCVDYYKTLLNELGLVPVYNEIYRCTVEARDCQGIKDCFGVTGPCDKDYTARCESGMAIFCDLIDHTTFKLNCGAAGLECQIDAQGSFSATCVKGSSTPKDDPMLPTGVDCGDGSCETTGESCSTDEFDRCEGEKLKVCLDGEWVIFDCAALNLGPCFQSAHWGNCTAPQ
jgi:hypothetical protein